MKRTRLIRRTPMPRPTKPLQVRTELRTRIPLRSYTPLRPVSDKRRRDNTHRAVVVSAMREACAGRCAHCGRTDMPVRGHERLARAHGGDILRPDVLVCDECNTAFEDDPRLACWRGWKLSPKWPHGHTLEPYQAWALDGSIVDFRVTSLELADGAL